MRIITSDEATFSAAFGIDMAHIEALSSAAFEASFASVAPGGESTPHQHDETEAFVVLRGEGELVVDNVSHWVGPGTVAVFEPFETHMLRNVGEVRLDVLDLYWRDPARAARASRNTGCERLAGRPVFVFSTPPTPNGDLHLGHLSGPYLGADTFVRFQRMRGVEAYHLTGSDDYQSYVVGCARKEGRAPEEVAAHYGAEIRDTLALMDIAVDQFTVTGRNPDYVRGLRAFFSRLVASGAVSRRSGNALFDSETGAYLYEVDVGGLCPTCRAPTGGNICEECGEPNTCVELIDPRSTQSRTVPLRRVVDRYSLPLHRFRDEVLTHHRRGKVSPRLQDLAGRVFERPVIDLPVTHPASWGVTPTEPTIGQQVIWVWPEMAFGFLYGIEMLGQRAGRAWSADAPQRDWKIVHFFGYDNSFYHTILFPVLYSLCYPDWKSDIEYNVNEFYLLDNKKFSTSRQHAIWGKDILSPETVDAVRYYLALTRSEGERTNFEMKAFRETIARVLVGGWQAWLADLGVRVAQDFRGSAPDAGSWSPSQSAFLGRLGTRLDTLAVFYGADGFSLSAAVQELNGLVEDVTRFAIAHRSLRARPDTRSEWRTAVALELAAARLLAQGAAPAMPRFAAKLNKALGHAGAPADWPDYIALVAPGSAVSLAGVAFFTLLPSDSAEALPAEVAEVA